MMSKRAFIALAVLLLVLIGLQARSLFTGSQGRLVVRATNAEVPIASEHARVFVHPAGSRDRVEAEGGASEAIALAPGHYDVRVWYSRSKDAEERRVESATITEGRTTELDVDFSAGELAVTAEKNVRVQVFVKDRRERPVAVFEAHERIIIDEGEYALRAALVEEGEEREVVWLEDVEVRAGMTTERTVELKRGTLEVIATNAGAPIPIGEVKLRVFAKGDRMGAIVAEGVAGLPLGLAAGEYELEAEWSSSADAPRIEASFAIAARQKSTVEMRFSSGTLLARAELKGGASLDGFKVYVHAYRPQDHAQAVAYAPSGRPLILSVGRYDLRAAFVRSHDRPDAWRRGIEIRAGSTSTITFTFDSGSLLMEAEASDGSPLIGDNVFVEIHPAGVRHSFLRARSGEEIVLQSGRYDVRAEDSRDPTSEAWVSGVEVRGGSRVVKAVRLMRSPPAKISASSSKSP
jgi:hypothetical protein